MRMELKINLRAKLNAGGTGMPPYMEGGNW